MPKNYRTTADIGRFAQLPAATANIVNVIGH